jgi:predicted O-methyltransferase YrrM
MHFLSQSLLFEPTRIYYIDKHGIEQDVMGDWEHPLMSASAAYITENGGDILEIGFGMGLSAGYMHSHSISSHTVVEIHPDIIPRAIEWAAERPNVTIITGSWYDRLNDLSTYDGILYDTYGDEHVQFFSSSLSNLVKPGAKATWFNVTPNPKNIHDIPDVEYQQMDINPTPNTYYNFITYYLPKKQF